ncbi:hypothetical protein Tco_0899686 [Tanacetum coccineum]
MRDGGWTGSSIWERKEMEIEEMEMEMEEMEMEEMKMEEMEMVMGTEEEMAITSEDLCLLETNPLNKLQEVNTGCPTTLSYQKLKGYARSAENKRRLENNPRDNHGQQPVFKRQNVRVPELERA